MGATRKLSSLLSLCSGRSSIWKRGISNYATASALVAEPTAPSVKIEYNQLLIDGKFVDAASGKTFPTLDPRTGDVIAHVAEGDNEDINRAVSASQKAFNEGPWPRMTPYERSRILLRFADLLEKNIDTVAALETWDSGKPYEQVANVEIPLVVRTIRYYAGWADKIHGLTVPADGPHHVQTLHEPIGVVGQIIPWNFPLLMYAWKIGPALACANTIILKTAEQTPLSALYVTNLLHEVAINIARLDIPDNLKNRTEKSYISCIAYYIENMFCINAKAGLPPGVLNVVSGFGPTAGAALSAHMDVDKIAFTGSTVTGQRILELASKSNLKSVTLELGGKSPFIVCEDADIDQAVELSHFALFFNQGQSCIAGSRTFVHENVYDEFVEKAKAHALKRVIGDPFEKGVEQGPQINEEQFKKILRYIRSGIESGATLEAGGDRFGSKGYYIQPTVFSNVKDDMLIAQDEIFGPVQSILKYKDLNDVIRRANTTHYGLAAGVFTQNLDTANTLTRALRAGSVFINCYNLFDAAIPFGGYKMSGTGREKGIYSLQHYLEVKAVVTPLKNSAWL